MTQAEVKTLVRVLAAESGSGYRLVIETADGSVVELRATRDQVESLARQLARLTEDEEQAGG
ncbi:hypothetical protein M446_1059 [Methylobacterium sp. 4-46]|uniref:hypothetical protein n=1 Tax=unclassified Methylobacterium TaxID=2615210 RepID=UPI000165C6D6|nr:MULTISPECIES: hypothetical protein [Methylobacterium]ACA15590.1 hypothetical protein M446_1059 [Methylobacterium sp. 4-46]WFT81300.1 hypothetical protein QA634_05245 [Methylobacterium nodulans]